MGSVGRSFATVTALEERAHFAQQQQVQVAERITVTDSPTGWHMNTKAALTVSAGSLAAT
jgi:hypothetical protein